jgi:hypothetical protein
MKMQINFETSSKDEDYLDDKVLFEKMLNVEKYERALFEIQQELRQIVKYRLCVESVDAEKLLTDFYYDRLPELLNGINLDD